LPIIDTLIGQVADGTWAAPLLGLAIGVLLTLSPVSLPAVPAVVATVSPGRLDAHGLRHRLPLTRTAPAVFAFVVGMDGMLAAVTYAVAELAVLFIRASVALHLFAAVLLGGIGVRLLLRHTSLCRRAQAIPLRPSGAFLYGLAFSVGGCPACGPIVVGLASAAALVAAPTTAMLVLVAFLLGRTAVLLAVAGAGGRLLPSGTREVDWARLDDLVGVLLLFAAGFYVWRVLNGDVTTVVPGEAGGLLP
jgi:cytochrome c biogenesis protein CcdA